ncbi:MAG TPA: CRISPR-associated endonuclease Cas3'' [Clostridiales bacterium]|nr:MAG: CRISPR-associated endonuclease Cas3'' [Clostridiales bacterium GWD2_32_19]HCC07893.1 CRISPR-associated endonuclease Cas3'' [Clostridiales bacterium]
MRYFAHSSENKEKPWQTINEHLSKTAQISSNYAKKFNAGDFGYTCGMFHDLGKYSYEFQRKLQGEVINVDHSAAGAREVVKLYGETLGKLMAYAIAGHHSGLTNHGTDASTEGTLTSRLYSSVIKDYSAYKNEFDFESNKTILNLPVKAVDKDYIGFT